MEERPLNQSRVKRWEVSAQAEAERQVTVHSPQEVGRSLRGSILGGQRATRERRSSQGQEDHNAWKVGNEVMPRSAAARRLLGDS